MHREGRRRRRPPGVICSSAAMRGWLVTSRFQRWSGFIATASLLPSLAAWTAWLVSLQHRGPAWIASLPLLCFAVTAACVGTWTVAQALEGNLRLRQLRPRDLGPEAFEAGRGPGTGAPGYRLVPALARLLRAGIRTQQFFLGLSACLACLAYLVAGAFLFVAIFVWIVTHRTGR